MLDTGVDIPEVVNLAFMKPVNSQIKFWQMIGRGTRHDSTCKRREWLPNGKKEDFLIVDFWENFEHFQMMPREEEGKRQIPVLVTIFNTRLEKLRMFLGDQSSEDARRILRDLRSDIARIPLESFSVRMAMKEVREAWPARRSPEAIDRDEGGEDDFWKYLTAQKIEFLKLKVAPLLRFVPDVNAPEAFFVSKMERCGLAMLRRKDLALHVESIREDVSLLPTNLAEVAAKRRYIDATLSNEFWANITLASLDEAKEALAPLMRYKRPEPSTLIELGLDDIIDSRRWVILRKDSQRLYVEEYRKRVEERIEQLADKHPTIKRLKQGEPVAIEDLIRLEETLEADLGTDEICLDDENMLKAFGIRVGSLVDFLKHVLKIETLPSHEMIVRKAFDAFILEHNYNADQSRFLRVVQSVFLQRKKVEVADLYEEPFTSFGLNAVEKLFSEVEIQELVALVKRLAA